MINNLNKRRIFVKLPPSAVHIIDASALKVSNLFFAETNIPYLVYVYIGRIKIVGVLEKNVLLLQKYIFEKFKSSNETFGHFYGR